MHRSVERQHDSRLLLQKEEPQAAPKRNVLSGNLKGRRRAVIKIFNFVVATTKNVS